MTLDLDVRGALVSTPKLEATTDYRDPTDMDSIDFHPDPLIFDVWHDQRRYVKFIAQDVWAFVPELYERVLGKELLP